MTTKKNGNGRANRPSQQTMRRRELKLSREFAEAHDAAAPYIQALNEAKAELKNFVEEHNLDGLQNKHATVSFRSSQRFDGSRFKKEHPKLHAEFQRESVSMYVNRTTGANGK